MNITTNLVEYHKGDKVYFYIEHYLIYDSGKSYRYASKFIKHKHFESLQKLGLNVKTLNKKEDNK